MDLWSQWIYQDAPRFGIDPRAANAISLGVEWPSRRGAGDSGTSYGPFQLHVGGALPSGRGRKWAESRAGVDYALGQMAAHGARGLRGLPAIQAISQNFERPASVAGEVSRAGAFYNGSSGSPTGLGQGVRRLATQAAAQRRPVQAPQGPNTDALISWLLNVAQNPGDPTVGLPEMVAAQQQAQQQPQTPLNRAVSPSQPLSGSNQGFSLGRIAMRAGADRAGVRTSPTTLNFARKVAGVYGGPLSIGTGSNHSRMTADNNVSDHWTGHAVDIPATGANLIRLGQAALIAAGMSSTEARKQRGGLYNVNGHQVIFNTQQGGDHTNHLHISAY